jgi:hypothetical protein
VLADAGYWHTAQMLAIERQGIEVLVSAEGVILEREEQPPLTCTGGADLPSTPSDRHLHTV